MDENMEVFSLEDYESSQLFITKKSNESGVNIAQNNVNEMDTNEDLYLGRKVSDFSSPCVSFTSKDSIYSDISDDEDFEMPCSQVPKW